MRRPRSRAASSRSSARSRTTNSDYDKEKLNERLAKLAGGVAVIRVGAATEIEMRERKARFDDALNATRAAIAEGVVPGGGVALLRAASALSQLVESKKAHGGAEEAGRRPVSRGDQLHGRRASRHRAGRQGAAGSDHPDHSNAGGEASVIVNEVKNGKDAFGYDAAKRQFGDLLSAGIIDPSRSFALHHQTRPASRA